MKALLLKALNVEPEESNQVMFLLAQGFFMGIFLASYDVGSVTLFIREFDEKTTLPLAVLASGGVGIVATYLFSYFQTKVSFRSLGLFWLALMVILVAGSWVGIEGTPQGSPERRYIYFFIFVLAIPFNYLALLVFWGAFNRLFNLRQAKRIIGGIDTGQLIASIVALFGIGLLLSALPSTEHLLLISGGAAIALFITFFILSLKYKLEVRSSGGEQKMKRYSLPKMLKNKYIALLAMFVIISMIAVYFVDYSFINVIGMQFPVEENLGQFIAYFEATVVIFSFLFQTFVTDWIIANYGLKVSLIINPILIGILTVVAIAIGTSLGFTAESEFFIYFFLIIAGSKLFIDSLKDALDGPTFKLYFLPIDPSVKFDVQTKIEGVITAFAGVIAGGLIIIMNNFNLDLIYVTLFLIPLVAAWYFVTNKMHNNYKETLQSTLDKNKGFEEMETGAAYSLESVLEREIKSKSDQRVIYGLKLMEKLEPGMFETSVVRLLDSDSNAIREFAKNKLQSLDLEFEKVSKDEPESDIEKLAMEAKGQSEFSEILSVPSSRLHALATSIKQEDRLLAAKLLRNLIDNENIFILLDLLRDPDPKVRYAAIATARKVKRPETWPILIEMLNSSTFGHAAAAALIYAGEDVLETLETAFHRSGQTQKVMGKIVQIIGRIGGQEAFKLLWKKIDFPDRKIVKQILKTFRSYDYRASEEEFGTIKDILEDEIGKAIWNMAAIAEIPKDDKNKYLIEALEEEIDSNYDHIYMLLSLLYEPRSIQLIKENIETGTADGIALGIELLDIFLHPDIKTKLFPLLDDISVADKVRKLQLFFPRENYSHFEVINYIINRDFNQINRWTKALAIKSIENLKDFKVSRGLIAQLFNPDPLLMETAAWIIYKKDKRTYQRVSQRLDENDKRRLDEKLFGALFFESEQSDFPLQIDKVLFLKEIDVFSEITGILLSQIVDKFKTYKLKDDQTLEVYDEYGDKPIFIVGKGEVTLHHDDVPIRTLKTKDVFGDIFSMDEEEKITSLTVRGETIIFQLGLNDFFDVMANQHELAQGFINNVSKKLSKEVKANT